MLSAKLNKLYSFTSLEKSQLSSPQMSWMVLSPFSEDLPWGQHHTSQLNLVKVLLFTKTGKGEWSRYTVQFPVLPGERSFYSLHNSACATDKWKVLFHATDRAEQ